MLIELLNLHTVVSSSDSVTNITKPLKLTPTNSYSLDSSTSMFRVVSHRNIHRKCKLRKTVINSSFFNSANSHDIASKFIVGRDRINILAKPGVIIYLQYFLYQYYFGSF